MTEFRDERADFLFGKCLDLRQKSPLVSIRMEMLIYEDAVAVFARRLLQRQGNQIAESAPGHRVLIGEEPVVGSEFNFVPFAHCAGKQRGSKFSRRTRGGRLSEKEPCVCAITGAGTLDCQGNSKSRANIS